MRNDYEELFLDIEDSPDKKVKESITELGESKKTDEEEEYIEVEEFECPICNRTLGEDDIKCPGCGAEFDDFDELPEKLVESSIADLDSFIKETASALAVKRSREELPTVSSIAKDRDNVREMEAEPALKDSMEYQEAHIESLMQELDFLGEKEPKIVEKSKGLDQDKKKTHSVEIVE
jgi:hypothetical protein